MAVISYLCAPHSVFVLKGMTMKPLVNFLKVEKADSRQKTMTEHIYERV